MTSLTQFCSGLLALLPICRPKLNRFEAQLLVDARGAQLVQKHLWHAPLALDLVPVSADHMPDVGGSFHRFHQAPGRV